MAICSLSDDIGLVDSRRLSVEVVIGHKLLDHFRIAADPQMLQGPSRLPLVENDGLEKLVCLANIFHLLPSAANIFLENLVNAIVQIESVLHFSGESPFSAPLARYLARYPSDAMDYYHAPSRIPHADTYPAEHPAPEPRAEPAAIIQRENRAPCDSLSRGTRP
ncbi:hypothetical protein BD311DRAFT_864790 [Dichomitus squalens]|uniref:Uncharacterized protein n=1 Tax=Dichomitus squalens TaxID=114155 RepID=A0A4Q9MP34_9APHY|nr:hypothetical protein BD311DRAFT_864790 [Dichomitus squalens]